MAVWVVYPIIEPQVGLHPTPDCVKVQATPLLNVSFCTRASNCWLWEGGTTAEVGVTDTEIAARGAEAIVISALADFVVSLTEVAVSVTIEIFGVAAGAE
ncbi:MAG: hypothetical protein WA817_02705 [Candidatus Acidiferrum sp.]